MKRLYAVLWILVLTFATVRVIENTPSVKITQMASRSDTFQRVVKKAHEAQAFAMAPLVGAVAFFPSVRKERPKFLRNRAELTVLSDALSDQKNLEAAREILLTPFPTRTDATEFARMKAIDLLVASLNYEQNPSKLETIQIVQQILQSNSFETVKDETLKKSMVGDKVELFIALTKMYPQAAKDILVASSGSSMEKIFTFARKTGSEWGIALN